MATAALPDHTQVPGARRRQHCPRRHLRPARPASFCARAPSRAGAAIHPGRAAWPGRCTASARSTASPATRASWTRPRACARFYIERTPAHGVPPNDWDEPNPALPYESSAAAIAASGLLNLAELVADPARVSAATVTTPLRILDTLPTPEFLADETPGWEGILKHGMYHQRKGPGRGRERDVGRLLLAGSAATEVAHD